jgi:uncharacterized delta-60 repeat protein
MNTLFPRASALPFVAALCLLSFTRPSAGLARPGDLDTSFGAGGIVTTDFPTNRGDTGSKVAVQSDGKILVAGTSANGTDNDFALARYNANGSPDTTFNGTGRVTTDLGSTTDLAYSVAVQSDGKILLAGASGNQFALVRYHGAAATGTPGTLDTAFGTGGIVLTTVISFDIGRSVVVQGDGNILVAGSAFNGTNYDFALVRYKNDGTLDASFGTGGIVTTPVGSNYDYATSMALQTDGKILVAGYSSNGSNYDFALVRYHGAAVTGTPGTLDTTFGTGGIVTTPIGSGDDSAYSVAVQSDGNIVVAGQSFNGSNDDFALVRYRKDGSLDPAFGTGGIVTTPVGTGYDFAYGMALQTDGKILVAGPSNTGGAFNMALVRYQKDGSLDPAFGTAGIVTTIFPNGSDANGVAVQRDGKILVAGTSYSAAIVGDFTLVRYKGDASRDLDGDGHEDLVLQYTNGAVFAWNLNGAGAISGSGFIYNGAVPGWTVVGVADMNHDGNPDIIFQHTSGAVFVWYRDASGAIASSGFVYNGAVPGWRVVGVADVNGDGNQDIVLQYVNGAVFVWYLNSSGGIGSSGFIYNGAVPGWTVAGVGDVNGDGIPDIVLQYTNGAVFVWYLNSSGGIGSFGFIYNGAVPGWRVAGLADLNNDGHQDIILQYVTGAVFVWYLNGAGGIGSSGFIYNGAVPGWLAH